MTLISLFRCVPKVGQIVKIRANVRSGCFSNNRRVTYHLFRLRCKSGVLAGLALTEPEFKEFAERGAAMANQVPGPLEIGKYYGHRPFVTRNNIRTDKVPLTVVRLYQHRTKTSIDEYMLAINPKQFQLAMERFRNNKQLRNRFCWWRRFLKMLFT